MRPNTPTFANPKAMALLSSRREYDGHQELSTDTGFDRDTWLTPRWILDPLGGFDTDPCASINTPHWVAPRSFTRDDDGLQYEWPGRVFMNPPFSDTRPWIERAANHGNCIALLPAVLESLTWRKKIWPTAKAIFVTSGRPRFCRPDTSTSTGRPLRPVALVAWDEVNAAAIRGVPFSGIHLLSWKLG